MTTLEQISYSTNITEGVSWFKTSKSISSLLKKAEKRLSETEDFNKRIEFRSTIKKLKEAFEVFSIIEKRFEKEQDPDNKSKIKEDFKKATQKYKPIIDEINSNHAIKVAIGVTILVALIGSFEIIGQQLEHKHQADIHSQDLKMYHNIAVKYDVDESLVKKIADLAVKEKIPKEIALALVSIESEWDVDAKHHNKNGTVDAGLCQLNSHYVKEFVKNYWPQRKDNFDINNPIDNATIAFRHLKELHKYFGKWKEAIMAYNAGITRVEAGNPPSNSVAYAERILGKEQKI